MLTSCISPMAPAGVIGPTFGGSGWAGNPAGPGRGVELGSNPVSQGCAALIQTIQRTQLCVC